MLSMEKVSLSLFEEETLNSFCISFKSLKAFAIALFIFFLHVRYFPPSIVNPVSASLLLRISDTSLRMLSFDCSRQSLTVLEISKSLRDPSNSSSICLLLHSCANACWEIVNWSNLSALSCKSFKSLSL
ncbi:hypothetical protein AAZV13_06G009850 [Glycine max]